MLRKLVWVMLLAAFVGMAGPTFGGAVPETQAYLRVLQLDYDAKSVSLTLEDGRTVIKDLAPGSVTDYLLYDVNRSTLIILAITPVSGQTFVREWSVPPLPPGHHTLALVGSSQENTLQLIFIDEDRLCEGQLAAGSCVILVNNIKRSPALTMLADNFPVIYDARYRHVVVNHVEAGSYRNFIIVDQDNPQTIVFRLQHGFFEPNVIYLYSLIGSYPGEPFSDYNIGSIRRVPVDSMTFLRGLTAKLQLTDGTTLFAMENIVAILEQSGFDELLANPQLSWTLFAPTDGAVLEAASDLYQCATSNPAAMQVLIFNHLLIGSYSPSQLTGLGRLSTMAGTIHSFLPAEDGFVIDSAVRVHDSFRYSTTNGSVYLVDKVLIPDGFAEQYCEQG